MDKANEVLSRNLNRTDCGDAPEIEICSREITGPDGRLEKAQWLRRSKKRRRRKNHRMRRALIRQRRTT